MSANTTYSGSCHCREITYKVDLPADPTTWELSRCNCTICHKKGYLAIGPKDKNTFTILAADDKNIGDYRFGTNAMGHRFCKRCGTSLFARGLVKIPGSTPDAEKVEVDMLMINVNTLDDVDLSKTKPKQYYNGREEKWLEQSSVPVAPGQW